MEQTQTMDKTPAKPTHALQSPWIIAWISMIVIVLAVNATMIYLAFRTNPGLVVDDYYERGQEFERTLISKLERDPGWLMKTDIPRDVYVDEDVVVRFFVVDQAGRPIVPDRVHFHAYRPSDADSDFALPMEDEGNGRYVAHVRFPLIGVWDTLVSVRHGEDEYNTAQRIDVKRF